MTCRPPRFLALVAVLLLAGPVCAAGDDGFVPLFNGKDLKGWVPVNVAPGTFTVKDGLIIDTGVPTGFLRTERMYENFIIELEWMHLKPKGNSGLFIWGDPIPAPGTPYARAIEVQILDGLETPNYTSHGDVFSIHGAKMKPDRAHPNKWERCLPSEHRSKPAGQWNHYRVECNDGVIKLAVNGKVVSGATECNPRKGYICLEAEGSETHFKNIKIKELPSTNPKPEQVALEAKGFVPLYTGVDLSGWKATPEHKSDWLVKDWVLSYTGKCQAKDPHLWTEKEYGDFELMCDWRLTAAPKKLKRPVILPTGENEKDADGKDKEVVIDDFGDSGIYLRGQADSQVNIWSWPIGSGEVWGYRTKKTSSPEVKAAVTPKVRADKAPGQWNRFLIRMQGDRLTVHLNGKLVIDNAQLPGVPKRGPIALQHHGDTVQFASILIRELKEGE